MSEAEFRRALFTFTLSNRPPGVHPSDWVEFAERLLKELAELRKLMRPDFEAVEKLLAHTIGPKK
jgi:hypothetical protein